MFQFRLNLTYILILFIGTQVFVCQRLAMKRLLEKQQGQDSVLFLSHLTKLYLTIALSHLSMSRYHPALLRAGERQNNTAHVPQFMISWFDDLVEVADNSIKTNL